MTDFEKCPNISWDKVVRFTDEFCSPKKNEMQ